MCTAFELTANCVDLHVNGVEMFGGRLVLPRAILVERDVEVAKSRSRSEQCAARCVERAFDLGSVCARPDMAAARTELVGDLLAVVSERSENVGEGTDKAARRPEVVAPGEEVVGDGVVKAVWPFWVAARANLCAPGVPI